MDDDDEVLRQVEEIISEMSPVAGRAFTVVSCASFDAGLQQLAQARHDLVILDVRAGDIDLTIEPENEAGRLALDAIKATRFVPIIFYTGLPQVVADLKVGNMIQVEQKAQSITSLESAVKAAFSSGLPSLRRGLERHLTEVLRRYMWGFVADHHDSFSEDGDQAGYLYLLLRRLSRSVTGAISEQLAAEVGLNPPAQVVDGKVPPMRYYVMPPIDATPYVTGDIYRADLSAYAPGLPFRASAQGIVEEPDEGRGGGHPGYWVLITPACDLATQANGKCKADNVLLAHAGRLEDQPELVAWRAEPNSGESRGRVKALLKNQRQKSQPDRFHYLPGAFGLPHLVVDFQQILSVPREALTAEGVIRIATLDDPYGAELVSRFTNYLNRIGSPDLDLDGVVDRLSSLAAPRPTG